MGLMKSYRRTLQVRGLHEKIAGPAGSFFWAARKDFPKAPICKMRRETFKQALHDGVDEDQVTRSQTLFKSYPAMEQQGVGGNLHLGD